MFCLGVPPKQGPLESSCCESVLGKSRARENGLAQWQRALTKQQHAGMQAEALIPADATLPRKKERWSQRLHRELREILIIFGAQKQRDQEVRE